MAGKHTKLSYSNKIMNIYPIPFLKVPKLEGYGFNLPIKNLINYIEKWFIIKRLNSHN